MEEAVLTGVATDKSEAKITVLGIPDTPGEAARIFRAVSDAEINIDMVLQNVSSLADNKTDITFTCPRADASRAVEMLKKLCEVPRDENPTVPVSDTPADAAKASMQPGSGASESAATAQPRVLFDDHVGKVSLVGAGMKSHPGVTADFCEALRDAGVNIELISTSEIRISVLIRDSDLEKATRALHERFALGGDEEAVVYAGTGR